MTANEHMSTETAVDIAWRGIEHCRRGEWTEGLYWLSLAAERPAGEDELPPVFYAYLGYGIARFEGKLREGLRLCQRAADLEMLQPEACRLLAQTHLLFDDRRSALDAVLRGLELDPANEGLLRLKKQLGERRPPVLGFLPRDHAVNRYLGRLRHRYLGTPSRRLP